MLKPLLTGVALAAAAALAAVSPAAAEPASEAETVTTATTFSVPADVAIEIPYDVDAWDDSGRITEGGLVSFPLQAEQYDGNFVHQSFAMSSEAADGCVRSVESFTFGYTLADYWQLGLDSTPVIGGVATGEPLDLVPFPSTAVSHTGLGFLVVEDRSAWVHLETMRENPDPQSGILTIAYPVPVASSEARGYIGFSSPLYTRWSVDNASFTVTDICTSEVAVPPVTPPVVESPTETAESSRMLAATGVNAGFAGSGAAAAILLGAGTAVLLLVRRRATR